MFHNDIPKFLKLIIPVQIEIMEINIFQHITEQIFIHLEQSEQFQINNKSMGL